MEFYTGKTGQDRVLRAIDFGTLDTAAYAENDILTSGAISIDAARFLGFSGVIERIILKETSSGTLQAPAIRLWFFGSAITPAARNSPQAFTSAQFDVLVGYTDIVAANWINGGTGVSMAQINPNLVYNCQSTSKTLYMVPELKASGETFASGATIKGQIVLRRD
jgi:hypothetical protein